MTDWTRHIRATRQLPSLDAALRAPITSLQGVTDAAANLLSSGPFHIATVFDLGTNRFFGLAGDVLADAADPDSALSRGVHSPSIFNAGFEPSQDSFAQETPSVLAGLSAAAEQDLADVLGIDNLHGLAHWPPFQAALEMLRLKQLGDLAHIDEAVPPDLVPRYNDHITEQTYFSTFSVAGRAGLFQGASRTDVLNNPIDLSRDCSDHVVLQPKIGARLSFEQGWLPTGLSMGTLQHAIGLAPGETTRVAVIDWTRMDSGRSNETVDENTSLQNVTDTFRAISEVSSAMARQAQNGFTSTNTQADTSSNSTSGFGVTNPLEAAAGTVVGATIGSRIGFTGGGAVGAVVGGVVGAAGVGVSAGPGIVVGALAGALGGTIVGGAVGGTTGFLLTADFGSTQQNSSTNALSTVTASGSTGERTLSAELSQSISSSTQQIASSVRSRRASVVQEVSQSESTNIRTRVVTNYNHMHALTIQYFEILQINQVRTTLIDAERVLYVPFTPISDWNEAVVERYLAYILNAALNFELALGLMFEQGTTVLQSQAIPLLPPGHVEDENLRRADDMEVVNDTLEGEVAAQYYDAWVLREPLELRSLAVFGLDNHGATFQHERVELRVTLRNGERQLLPARFIPAETLAALPNLQDIADITLLFEAKETALVPRDGVVLSLSLATPGQPGLGVPRNIAVPDLAPFGDGLRFEVPFATIFRTPDQTWIDKHLEQNAEYYTRHILGSLSLTEMQDLLSQYHFDDVPLHRLVDGPPIAMSGNHLIFRYPFHDGEDGLKAEEARLKWLELQGIAVNASGRPDRATVALDTVPMPTGGVFAEAIQGRANSAELLDLERFWDWNSSPIGKSAPDIAAVQAANRTATLGAAPGAFASPLVSIQTAPALPNPTGQAALLDTLGKSGLFRNIAGLQESSAFAQQALKSAAEAASAGGAQSSKSLVAGLEATSKVIKSTLEAAGDIGAAVAKTGLSIAGGSGATGLGASASIIGGLLNAGRGLDEKKATSGGGTESGGSGGSGGSGSGDTGDGGGAPSSGGGEAGPGGGGNFIGEGTGGIDIASGTGNGLGFEEQAFVAALGGSTGGNVVNANAGSSVGSAGPPPAPIPEPEARPCCAIGPAGVTLLGFGIGHTRMLGPDEIAGHRYGSGGLVNAARQTDAVGQIYTLKGGFVDLGHVRDLADLTRYLTAQAIDVQAVGGLTEIASEAGRRSVTFNRYTAAPNPELAAMLSARAAYQFAIWHEIVTWFTNIRYSAFSPEDNYSNLLGCYLGARASLAPGGNYNAAVDSILSAYLEELGAVERVETQLATDAVAGLWFDDRVDLTNALTLGSLTGTPTPPDYLLRRHVIAQPVVRPWLVTDLHGQTFNIPDPVAGPGVDKTIDYLPGGTKPAPFDLIVPTRTSSNLILDEYFEVVIDVNTDIVPASFLPDQRTRITGRDLAFVTEKVKDDILLKFPGTDTPI